MHVEGGGELIEHRGGSVSSASAAHSASRWSCHTALVDGAGGAVAHASRRSNSATLAVNLSINSGCAATSCLRMYASIWVVRAASQAWAWGRPAAHGACSPLAGDRRSGSCRRSRCGCDARTGIWRPIGVAQQREHVLGRPRRPDRKRIGPRPSVSLPPPSLPCLRCGRPGEGRVPSVSQRRHEPSNRRRIHYDQHADPARP